MPPREVFLSHASQDHEVAERISRLLHAHGVPTFYSPTNLLGAQQWQDEILKALQRCDWFAVLLSPEATRSMWVRRETAYALRDPRFDNQIIPLMYRPCELGFLDWLQVFQLVDFQGDFREACQRLLRIWGIGLRADSDV